MAIFQVESDTCHGRGFSRDDSNGFLARLASFLMRPAVDGASQNFTVNATTDQATCTAHGYSNGDPIIVTSTTTLPAPLTETTEYYIIYVDANTFQLATTYGNAIDGVAVDLTDTGTGTHSVYAKGGGANYHVFADYSDSAAQNFATTDVNTGADTITLTAHTIEQGMRVRFSTTGTLPSGISSGTTYIATVVDANTIKLSTSEANWYSLTYVDITTTGSGTHTMTKYEFSMYFCNTVGATANDYNTGPDGGPPKFIRISMYTEAAGFVGVQSVMWHDLTAHASYGFWHGMLLATYDDADFAYDIRGGDECYLFSTRLGTAWDCVGLDTFVGDANLVEGTDKVGVLQSGVTAGSSVVLQLDTGEAANFTVDKWYFLFDYSIHTWNDYVKVTNVDTGTDQITVDAVYQDFPAGSVIGAYVHRWVGFGDKPTYTTAMQYFYRFFGETVTSAVSVLPYVSDENAVDRYSTTGEYIKDELECVLNYPEDYLTCMNPNDEGNQAVMRPGINEYNDNRGYGILKNIFICRVNSMASFLDGKTIGGKNYLHTQTEGVLFYQGSTNYATLFLDSESSS